MGIAIIFTTLITKWEVNMEKEMLAIAKLKSGEGKFEKFMGFMQSEEGMGAVSYTHLTLPTILLV